MAKVKHVVVDSGGFIRNAPLRDIGDQMITIRDVVAEIRDKETRRRLQVLPYDLSFREPSTECIRIVTDFSKKTGDYRNLSAVDIRVIALTYQLEKEHCGDTNIKAVPDTTVIWESSNRSLHKPTEIAGFYLQTKGVQSKSRTSSVSQDHDTQEILQNNDLNSKNVDIVCTENYEPTNVESSENINGGGSTSSGTTKTIEVILEETHLGDTPDIVDCISQSLDVDSSTTADAVNKVALFGDGVVLTSECISNEKSNEDSESSDDEEDDEDDDDGWITPKNIKSMKMQMGDPNIEVASVTVGCLTTDFAMQNVLIQMGLNVISVDGMLIKKAKSYVLRCYGCFKISTELTRKFCKHCGNNTLQRVSVTLNEDGTLHYFLSTRRALTVRGKKFSLPAPRGGKYASNPVLVEDQKEAQQRSSNASHVKYDVLDQDYVRYSSPFAPIDTQSRAAQLGFNRFGKQKRGGKRK